VAVGSSWCPLHLKLQGFSSRLPLRNMVILLKPNKHPVFNKLFMDCKPPPMLLLQ
jgi:hypothetical protein